jgi:hypothetical protein
LIIEISFSCQDDLLAFVSLCLRSPSFFFSQGDFRACVTDVRASFGNFSAAFAQFSAQQGIFHWAGDAKKIQVTQVYRAPPPGLERDEAKTCIPMATQANGEIIVARIQCSLFKYNQY